MFLMSAVITVLAYSLSCCSEGVYRDRRCSLKPSELNHAVMLVGWGTDKVTNEPYWVVKNSECGYNMEAQPQRSTQLE